jgi:hypothetical protein
MNNYYRNEAQNLAQHAQTTLFTSAVSDYRNSLEHGYPVHEYEIVSYFTVSYNRDCALSLFTDHYEYTGGAHGVTVQSSDTWDLSSGARLPLQTLFPGNREIEHAIKRIVTTQVAMQIQKGEYMYFEDYAERIQETYRSAQYYLTADALAVYFQQYDIAPYITGLPTFFIEYAESGIRLPHCRENGRANRQSRY